MRSRSEIYLIDMGAVMLLVCDLIIFCSIRAVCLYVRETTEKASTVHAEAVQIAIPSDISADMLHTWESMECFLACKGCISVKTLSSAKRLDNGRTMLKSKSLHYCQSVGGQANIL